MPSKKRKYESRFPPARIKKIMQTNEEIGKVAGAVPIIISRSLEIFLQSLVETTAHYTSERRAKTMTTSHLKHCIESEKKFDFLKELVANIADVSNQDEEDGAESEKPKRQRKPRAQAGERKKRKKESSSDADDSDAHSEEENSSRLEPPVDESNESSQSQLTANFVPSTLPSVQPLTHSIDAIIGSSQKLIQESPITDSQDDIMHNVSQSPTASFTPNVNFTHSSSTLSSNPATMPLMMSSSIGTSADDEDDDYDMDT